MCVLNLWFDGCFVVVFGYVCVAGSVLCCYCCVVVCVCMCMLGCALCLVRLYCGW